MCHDKQVFYYQIHTLFRCRIHWVFFALLFVWLCPLDTVAQETADSKEQTASDWVAALLEVSPEHARQINRLTDGTFKAYLESLSHFGEGDATIIQREFFDNIRSGEARSLYIEFILLSLKSEFDPWAIIAKSAPPSVLVDAFVSAAGQDDDLRHIFLTAAGVAEKTGPNKAIGVHHLLSDYERPSTLWAPWSSGFFRRNDFRVYEQYLHTHDSAMAAPLIEYILLQDPSKAIGILLEAYAGEFDDPESVFDAHMVVEKRLWAERNELVRAPLDNATADALERLGMNKNWWVRLYVLSLVSERHGEAEMIYDLLPWFTQSSDLIVSLYDDSHPVVRRVARHYVDEYRMEDRLADRPQR